MRRFRWWMIGLGLCAALAFFGSRLTNTWGERAKAGAGASQSEFSKLHGEAFGQEQLKQILRDRPDMADALTPNDPIRLWVISSLGGDRIGQRIFWSNELPLSGSVAEHWPAYQGCSPSIRLKPGPEVTGIDKWVGLVYELFNLENSEGFALLHSRACEGKLNGDAYADGCAKLEFLALKKSKAFFEEHPIPQAKEGSHPQYDQLRDLPETFPVYLEQFRDPDGTLDHPGKYFKDEFDQRIAPYIEKKRKWEASNLRGLLRTD